MRGEIITIGDELITGRVRDLNTHFLAARMSSYGFEIQAFSSIGDDPARIIETLRRAVARSAFVLVSGGLGPTEDDITARTAAECFGTPLEQNDEFLEVVKGYVREKGYSWVESYRKMAQIPRGATMIDPRVACGFYLFYNDVPVYFLPGVPAEVETLVENRVLPHLLSLAGKQSVLRRRLFRLFGLEEAEIGEKLAGLHAETADVNIGYYPNFPETHVTVSVRRPSVQSAENDLADLDREIESRLGAFIVGRDRVTLEESVGRLLRERGWTIAAAESCTGGLIGSRLTAISGSSDYFDRGLVTYSNRAKMELLGVPEEILETHGAVSRETALAMAASVRERSRTDIGLSSTGIAGPTGGSPEKPVGTVWIGLSGPDGDVAEHFRFPGNRNQVTMLTAEAALSRLYRYLSKRPL